MRSFWMTEIEDNWEFLGVHGDLAFSKVNCRWVFKMLMLEHKASYCSKNSGNHQPVWFGTAATFSLQSRNGSFRFLLSFCMKQYLQEMMKYSE